MKHDEVDDPIAARRQKLAALVSNQTNPYPSAAVDRTPIQAIRDHGELACAEADTEDTKVWHTAGRIIGLRGQGGIVFLDLKDESNQIQIVAKEDTVTDGFDLVPNLDMGDFIQVTGNCWRTRRGELSLKATHLKLLTKSLRPLPSVWFGLKDQEARFRQRYVDLTINKETRQIFDTRSKFIKAFRDELTDKYSFSEVETPTLEQVPGGADAEPFATHHNSLDIDVYMRISLELHLKRLIVGGYEKVFEIGRCFRNEGISPQHLQEFTMCELYWAYADYESLMKMIEDLYAAVITKTFGSTVIKRAGQEPLDFTPPWPRVKYVDLMKEATGLDIMTCSDEDLVAAIKKFRVDTDLTIGRARLIDQLYKKTVRPNLKPVQFLIDPPLVMSPLAKAHRDNSNLAERFWVLAEGAEIGNGFSELNDPIDQYQRFAEQEKLRLAGDAEAQRLDLDYVRALQYGMPPTAGFGVGFDRLLTILTGVESIRDTVLFPMLRPEPESELKDIKEASDKL